MAKNMARTRKANLVISMTAPAGTKSGEVIKVGDAGLTGFVTTDAYASYDEASHITYPQGMTEANEVSVELVGVSLSARLEVEGGASLGDAVYLDSAAPRTYTTDAEDNHFIGYALAEIADGAIGEVGLASFAPAPVES